MEIPLVSVIVHTRNSERTIRRHLQSIKEQTYSDIEIIAVDNHSTDKTKKILEEYTDKVFEYGPERSAQRNYGVKKSSGKYVLIPDSDMILARDIIEKCVIVAVNNISIKAIVIPEKSVGRGFWTKCKALERSCYVGDEDIEAARFFEKTAYKAIGGYDESMTGPEDWDLDRRMRKQYSIGRIRSFINHDEGNLTLFSLMKKKYYYAKKASVFMKKHSKHTVGSQSIYFLRPAFYRNWQKLIRKPKYTSGMIFMLFCEQLAGGLGFIVGRVKN